MILEVVIVMFEVTRVRAVLKTHHRNPRTGHRSQDPTAFERHTGHGSITDNYLPQPE